MRVILPLLLVLICQETTTQLARPLTPGDVVRVSVGGKKVSGVLEHLSPSRLIISRRGGRSTLQFDPNTISRLELGTPRSPWRNVGIGMAVGAAAGVATTLYIVRDCVDCMGGLVIYGGATYFVLPLALAGGLIGALLPDGHRWRIVPALARPRTQLLPTKAAGLALRVTF
ncbi:MAG: hypothetical protein AAGI08_13465 [Bacteroidota bacterium]